MNRIFKIKILSYISSIIATLAVLSLGIESVTYCGFVQRHFLISSTVIVWFSLISLIIFFFTDDKFADKQRSRQKSLLKMLYLPLFVSSLLLIYVESINYSNFVFSKVHIQPQNLFALSTYLLIYIFCLDFVNEKKIIKYLILITSFIQLNSIIKEGNKTYDDKLSRFYGKCYLSTQFINKLVPENGTLIVPPQDNSVWPCSGNVSLLRYFLYPRNLINYDGNLFPASYILISSESFPNKQKIWPDFDIKDGEYYIFDFKNNQIKYTDEYKYVDNQTKGNWGLIKLK